MKLRRFLAGALMALSSFVAPAGALVDYVVSQQSETATSVSFTLNTSGYYQDDLAVLTTPSFITGKVGTFEVFKSQEYSTSSSFSVNDKLPAGYYVEKWVVSTQAMGLGTVVQTQQGGREFTVTFNYQWASRYGTYLELTVYIKSYVYGDLSLTLGTGIDSISYRTDMDDDYSTTSEDAVVGVAVNTNWYAYAVAKPGYTHTATSAERPASGLMTAAGDVFNPSATPNTICVRYNGNGATGSSMLMNDSTFTYDVAAQLRANSFLCSYTVTFAAGQSGASVSPTSQTISYDFAGWNSQADGRGAYSYGDAETVVNVCGSTGSTADVPVNLYAQWKLNSSTAKLPKPTCDGYDFLGWYDASGVRAGGAGTEYAPVSTVTLTAHWSPHASTVKFNANGGTMTEGDRVVAYNTTYGATGELPVPTRSGYVFVGWYAEKECINEVTADTVVTVKSAAEQTLYAKWKNNFAITYETNGGVFSGEYVQTYTMGYAVTLPTNINKDHATFKGWYDNERFYGEKVTVIAADASGDKTFYAKWQNETCKLTYRPGSGVAGEAIAKTVDYNSSIALEGAIFRRLGYDQTGWSESDGGAKKCDLGDRITLPNDLTLYPYWTAHTYTIKFDANGGESTMSDLKCTYDKAVMLTECGFTKEGKVFGGWAREKNGAAWYQDEAMVSNLTSTAGETVTLYAVWNDEAAVKTYTIQFSPGATVVNPYAMTNYENCVATDKIVLPPCIYTNYLSCACTNWYCETDGKCYAAGDVFTHDLAYGGEPVVMRALWKDDLGELSTHIDLTNAVLWQRTGGSYIDWDATVVSKTNILRCVISTLGKEGVLYTYLYGHGKLSFDAKSTIASGLCWTDGITNAVIGECENPTTFEFEITNDVTLAKWLVTNGVVNLYNITWTPTDPTARPSYQVEVTADPVDAGYVMGVDEKSYKSGTNVVMTAVSTNQNYVFKRWSDGLNVACRTNTVYSDVKYSAIFGKPEIGTYHTVFDAAGGTGTMAEMVMTNGVESTLIANAFTRTGYTFDGWRDAQGNTYEDGAKVTNLTKENGVAILTATWKANSYTIVFDKNGGEGEMAALGCTYDAPAKLTECGFTKAGYNFDGWSTSAKGEGTYSDGQVVTNLTDKADATVTLFALWSVDPGRTPVTVTITGNTATKHYTGKTLAVDGYTVAIEPSSTDYRECDFTFGGEATASGTAVGTYYMNLKPEDFTNRNRDFEVTFTIGSQGALSIVKSAIAGEPGSGSVPEGGVSKYDVTAEYGDTFDATALTAAFTAAYGPVKIEYATKSDAYVWSENPPQFTSLGLTTFWYRVNVSGYDEFKHEISVTVVQRSIERVTVAAIADQTYTGSAIEPELTVTDGGLIAESDYTVTYANNVNVGTATVTLKGQNNYTGLKTVTFNIVAAPTPTPTPTPEPEPTPTGPPSVYTNMCGEAVTVDLAGAYTDKTLKSVTSLPSGLKYNKKTGLVTGTPKKAYPAGRTVKLTFTDKSKLTVTWIVLPLPEEMVGTYYGAAWVTDGTVGQFQLKLTAAGKVTGSFYASGKKVTVKSTNVQRVAADDDTRFVTTVEYKYNKVKYYQEVTLATTNAVRWVDIWGASTTAESGDVITAIDAQCDVVTDLGGVASGKYAVMAENEFGEYLTAKVTKKGAVTVSGKLLATNGKLATVSCKTHLLVAPDGKYYCWITLYKKNKIPSQCLRWEM